jgi:hypothetical protein
MNDQELLETIRKYAQEANAHRPDPWCSWVTRYADGQPPAGWQPRAAALAAREGWMMKYSPAVCLLGADGATTGAFMYPGDEHQFPPRHVLIKPGMEAAHEFTVTCHELGHALLRHPVDSKEQADMLLAALQETGKTEFFEHETACHLAAMAVSDAAGLTVTPRSVCYLHKRVQGFRRLIGEEQCRAAFHAARIIRDAVL